MSDSPSNVGRRTRRARRVSLEAYEAMQREGQAARVRAEQGTLVADPDPGTDLEEPGSNGEVQSVAVNPAAREADLQPPAEAQFAGKDFLPAPGLRRVATALIARDNNLRHLDSLHVEFLWKRRGGSTRGRAKTGDAVMPAGLSRHAWNQMAQARTGNANERVPFVVWLAADHVSNYNALQIEATLYHNLLKLWFNPRDHSEFRLRAPEQMFIQEIERYGLWRQSLVEAAPAFRRAHATDQVSNGTVETTSVEGAPEHT